MTSLKLTARLTDSGGAPLSGKPIYFYYSTDGSTWINFVAVATDENGYASATYDASGKTWFKAEFKGDDFYEPASATAVWEPSAQPPPPPSPQPSPGQACSPVFKTGIEFLDQVLFCVGGYGVTVTVLLMAVTLLILLVGR
jgi:hypothetical protein